MKEGMGSVVLYNIIIIFILIVFGLLAATLSYYKAFKVNSRILFSIDKFEGYNGPAISEINNTLTTLGYSRNHGNTCPERKGAQLVENQDGTFDYCVYLITNDAGGMDEGRNNGDGEPIYYNYSVVSYIYIDLPIVDAFRIPIYTKGERIYNFTDEQGWSE